MGKEGSGSTTRRDGANTPLTQTNPPDTGQKIPQPQPPKPKK